MKSFSNKWIKCKCEHIEFDMNPLLVLSPHTFPIGKSEGRGGQEII